MKKIILNPRLILCLDFQSECAQTADVDRVGQYFHIPGTESPEPGEGETGTGQQRHAEVQELLPGTAGRALCVNFVFVCSSFAKRVPY